MVWQTRKVGLQKGKLSYTIIRANHFRPDGRQVTINTEVRRFQKKYPLIFVFYSSALSAVKQTHV
jgi:hypothetical protein